MPAVRTFGGGKKRQKLAISGELLG